LAQNHRTKKKDKKTKRQKPQNKYEILASKVIRSGKGGGNIRQKEMEEEVKCFRY